MNRLEEQLKTVYRAGAVSTLSISYVSRPISLAAFGKLLKREGLCS